MLAKRLLGQLLRRHSKGRGARGCGDSNPVQRGPGAAAQSGERQCGMGWGSELQRGLQGSDAARPGELQGSSAAGSEGRGRGFARRGGMAGRRGGMAGLPYCRDGGAGRLHSFGAAGWWEDARAPVLQGLVVVGLFVLGYGGGDGKLHRSEVVGGREDSRAPVLRDARLAGCP